MTRVGWTVFLILIVAIVGLVLIRDPLARRRDALTCRENIRKILVAERDLGTRFGGYTEDVATLGLPTTCPGHRSLKYVVVRSVYGVLSITCPNAKAHTTVAGHNEDYQGVLMEPSIYAAKK